MVGVDVKADEQAVDAHTEGRGATLEAHHERRIGTTCVACMACM
jgi:hypothetical protein